MSTELAARASEEALIFIHGFNVTFENAAYRAAQIAYDVGFQGVPMFYSWPSAGAVSSYPVDEANVEWTQDHLVEFLKIVAGPCGVKRVHLVVHSMGNRAVLAAMRELNGQVSPTGGPWFEQVALAAPDVDAAVFTNTLPRINKVARRITLYASSEDQALVVSKKVHGYARAGEAGASLVLTRGLDTIDATGIDTSLLGHSYYGDCERVIEDLQDLLVRGQAPPRRLLVRRRDQWTYWALSGR